MSVRARRTSWTALRVERPFVPRRVVTTMNGWARGAEKELRGDDESGNPARRGETVHEATRRAMLAAGMRLRRRLSKSFQRSYHESALRTSFPS